MKKAIMMRHTITFSSWRSFHECIFLPICQNFACSCFHIVKGVPHIATKIWNSIHLILYFYINPISKFLTFEKTEFYMDTSWEWCLGISIQFRKKIRFIIKLRTHCIYHVLMILLECRHRVYLIYDWNRWLFFPASLTILQRVFSNLSIMAFRFIAICQSFSIFNPKQCKTRSQIYTCRFIFF